VSADIDVGVSPAARDIAAAKVNLALHVRGRMPDGRHRLETVFAFCTDGDRVEARFDRGAGVNEVALQVGGPFADAIDGPNLIERAWTLMQARAGQASHGRTAFALTKNLPVASGIGGGSADAAAALRLMTALWRVDPAHAAAVAQALGADVPACLLSMTVRGDGVGDALVPVASAGVAGTPVLLVNPRVSLSTAAVFAQWDGVDRGPLEEDWRAGRNDLEAPARILVPAVGAVLEWLGGMAGVALARMSGSGATCFGLFEDEAARDEAAANCPPIWWHLATTLR
jgi:4-diphosphocytidyl-2-C-methyl-D-erythritol kinase